MIFWKPTSDSFLNHVCILNQIEKLNVICAKDLFNYEGHSAGFFCRISLCNGSLKALILNMLDYN
jgi:hypothetical protein